ncbi:MAG: MoxR family ATPase [Elusimicrobia bacterium]|nr:MoxR family ATPase [Elusimicrobiota bacterium]
MSSSPTASGSVQEQIQKSNQLLSAIRQEISKVIVGQEELVQRLLCGLLANGHLLLEGVPGLAKTLVVKTLAQTLQASFQRIQFTPDLLPADLIGTQIFNPKEGTFQVRRGPIFTHILLGDEINRAPAKVQSALLEAMQERQVTLGEKSHGLPNPFLVLATQNPIEQEGTYPLPEAQVDRFLFKLKVNYPNFSEERIILERMTQREIPRAQPAVQPEEILQMQTVATQIYVDDKVKNYILNLIFATRQPENFHLKDLKPWIAYGASPRATLHLTQAAKAYALLSGRAYVTPEDIKSIGMDVLRHRILTSYEAEAENITSEAILQKLFDTIEVP